jgi:hypothetical protein
MTRPEPLRPPHNHRASESVTPCDRRGAGQGVQPIRQPDVDIQRQGPGSDGAHGLLAHRDRVLAERAPEPVIAASLFLLDLNGGADDVSGNGIARLFLTIVSAFAEFERDRIGERIRATKRAQRARGEYLGGPPPFGYTYCDGKLMPVPEQQRELRRIRKLHADGLSPYKISADLASRGVKLSHVTIRKIVAGRRHQ